MVAIYAPLKQSFEEAYIHIVISTLVTLDTWTKLMRVTAYCDLRRWERRSRFWKGDGERDAKFGLCSLAGFVYEEEAEVV